MSNRGGLICKREPKLGQQCQCFRGNVYFLCEATRLLVISGFLIYGFLEDTCSSRTWITIFRFMGIESGVLFFAFECFLANRAAINIDWTTVRKTRSSGCSCFRSYRRAFRNIQAWQYTSRILRRRNI